MIKLPLQKRFEEVLLVVFDVCNTRWGNKSLITVGVESAPKCIECLLDVHQRPFIHKYHRRWISSVVEYRFKTLWCHVKNKDGLIGITACNQTAYGPCSNDHKQE